MRVPTCDAGRDNYQSTNGNLDAHILVNLFTQMQRMDGYLLFRTRSDSANLECLSAYVSGSPVGFGTVPSDPSWPITHGRVLGHQGRGDRKWELRKPEETRIGSNRHSSKCQAMSGYRERSADYTPVSGHQVESFCKGGWWTWTKTLSR